jgi:hypothetical protein
VPVTCLSPQGGTVAGTNPDFKNPEVLLKTLRFFSEAKLLREAEFWNANEKVIKEI